MCNSQKTKIQQFLSTMSNFHYEFVRGLQNKAIVHIYLIKTS